MTLPRTAALLVSALAMVVGVQPVAGGPSRPAPLAAPEAAGAAAPCGQGSWVAGSTEVCDGELVHRDYVYDDFGGGAGDLPPPLGQLFGVDGSTIPTFDAYGGLPPAGAQRYPAGQDNTADLVGLRVRLDGSEVRVSFELNTLFDPGTTRAAIAVDTDDNAATGGGAWPGFKAGRTPELLPLPVTSTGWDALHTFGQGRPGTIVDTAANTIEGSFPLPAGTGPGSTWRFQALVARADGTVMNVAFRGTDETGFWWDSHQSAALATGVITDFRSEPVAVDDLRTGATRRATTPAGQVLQRVYISSTPVPPGEGISHDGVPGPGRAPSGTPGGTVADSVSQAFNFLGKYQPYGFYLPSQAGPHGAQLLMHGLSENHSARLYLPGPNSGKITDHIGEARNRILVSPLGRGWKGWYSSYSERDVLDALDDATANYPVDTTQIFAGGYSMGGYGSLRLGALHPERFAGIVQWVGYTGDCFSGTPLAGNCTVGAFGNAADLVGNLRHIPGAMLYAGLDELVAATTALELEKRLQAAGVPHEFFFHPVAEHLTFALADDWRKESAYSAGRVRRFDPTRVTFRTDEALWIPELDEVYDHAYWVQGIEPAGPGYADVDALSHGCGGTLPVVTPSSETGLSPVPWVGSILAETASQPLGDGNRLELTLTNVAALDVVGAQDPGAVAGDQACVDPGPLEYRVVTDGPTTISFTDGRTLPLPAAGTYEGILAGVGSPTEPPGSTQPPGSTEPPGPTEPPEPRPPRSTVGALPEQPPGQPGAPTPPDSPMPSSDQPDSSIPSTAPSASGPPTVPGQPDGSASGPTSPTAVTALARTGAEDPRPIGLALLGVAFAALALRHAPNRRAPRARR